MTYTVWQRKGTLRGCVPSGAKAPFAFAGDGVETP
jgi:hypothetical protein